MVIKSSAASGVRALVQALSSADELQREAAIARIAVIGDRAVPHVIAAYRATPDRAARAAMLRALEPIADSRAGALAREALAEGGDPGVAAAGLLRHLLASRDSRTAAESLDALMTVALNASAERRVRLAVLDALEAVPEVRTTVAEALRAGAEPEALSRARVLEESAEDALWSDALDGRFPDDPRALRAAVQGRGATAPLSALHKLVDGLRAREGTAGVQRAGEWRAVRGAVHQALALRGSRVALYDLRESIAAATPGLPVSFVAAIQVIGDAASLEDVAAAYARSAADDVRWRSQLTTAFRTIAAREKVSRRHAVMKRLQARWPDSVRDLSGK